MSPAVDSGRVFVGSDDSNVYAFPSSCSTPCAPVWTAPTAGRISTAPAVSNGTVYVGAGNGAEGDLWAFDEATGAVEWTAHLPWSPNGVAVSDGVVYAANGSLYAFPASCSTPCAPLWLGQGASAVPAVGGGAVFSDAGFVNNGFQAFAASASCSTPCFPSWTGFTNSGTTRAAAVAGSSVYLAEGDGSLAAFPVVCTTPCSPSWTSSIGGSVSDPAVANGVVYAGTDNALDTFDAASGASLLSFATGAQTGSPAIVNGAVYVSTFDFDRGGRVNAYVLNPVDTTPPTLNVPSDITVVTTDPSGGVPVDYTVTAADNVDQDPVVNCTPPSGSTFPIGTTSVTCTATDASGNSSSASFNVTVLAPWHFVLTLARRDSVNVRTGVVTVAGTVQCNRTGDLFTLFVQVTQLIAHRATLNGQSFTSVTCTAPSSTWSTAVAADNGRFKPGSAEISASGFGCELTCDSGQTSATVTLRG